MSARKQGKHVFLDAREAEVLRLATGWLFFSAFHRRLLLDMKLDPEAASYVGRKFNTFMPGSILGVDQLIATLLDHPAALEVFLWSFTIIEALVGLALILGLGTRLAALGVLLLSAGILFGAGWLGPTCLDEWQIGAFGIAGGAGLMLGGGGALSLDAWLARTRPGLFARPWVGWAAAPAPASTPRLALALALFQTLAATAPADIDNRWLVAVQTGPHGLVVPLGGRATVSLPTLPRAGALAPGRYRVEWEDVSGARWSSDLALEPMAAGSGPRSARLERN